MVAVSDVLKDEEQRKMCDILHIHAAVEPLRRPNKGHSQCTNPMVLFTSEERTTSMEKQSLISLSTSYHFFQSILDSIVLYRYDQILIEGLPDWKQPLFYYRRMRKMGLGELSLLLLSMASVAHYVYGWAVFAEKQLVLV